jgi:hypothetical protein
MLNLLNGIPELIIILFGPFIISIITTVLFLIDHLYVMYLWFANMGWFFKQNTNTNLDHKPIWSNVTILKPFDYCCAIGLIILFCCLFWLLVSTLPILPSFTMLWCMFTLISYKGLMDNSSVTVLAIIQDIFKYYKVTIMSIFSFFIITSAFTTMGSTAGIFSLIVLILIYFGVISINLFQPVGKTDMTQVVSNEQAKKTCNIKRDTDTKKHGLLYTLIFGQSGGKISNELKKLGKNLTNVK